MISRALTRVGLQRTLRWVVVILVILGAAMVISTTVIPSLKDGRGAYDTAIKEIAIMFVGLGLAWIVSRLPFEDLRFRPILGLATLGAILAMAVPYLFDYQINGAYRWIPLGFVTVQPSEFVRLLLPIFVASFFLAYERRGKAVQEDDKLPLAMVGIATAVMMTNKDVEGTLLLVLVGMMPLVLVGMNRRRILSLSVIAIVVTLVMLFRNQTNPFRAERVHVWLNPSTDDATSQVTKGTFAFNRGGITGVGPGASQGSWGDVPNASSDFVFPIIGEEYGLIGALVVVALFTIILWLGYVIFKTHPNILGRLTGFTLAFGIATQAFINMASTVRILPVTGLTLPILSTGGSSKLAILLTFGVLYRLCGQCDAAIAQGLADRAAAEVSAHTTDLSETSS